MTTIKLHNTKSRKKEDFVPIDANNVRMYVCGPTVYDRAHIGNARPVVVFDVLYRLLREVYGADHVTYVRNFTDVDDKINATAQARKEAGAKGTLEELVRERTEETIDWYLKDMGELGAMQPNHMPRATQYIAQMIAMNEDLIAKGHAYAAEGHVLFAVDSWKEHYGKLSGRSVDDMIAGARVEVAPYKRNPMDFVLWKPSTDEQPGWESPWGRGRPGWHIECSAMAKELLGVSFDIHGGGNDLMFPHHENEIAQSCCADPDGGFANYWLHNEMLQVDGKKMSKSLGNFFTVRDLLDKYDREFAIANIGPAIRLRFLDGHYRSRLDAGHSYIEAAATRLGNWWFALHPWLNDENTPTETDQSELLMGTSFFEALCDDLNTRKALLEIDDLVSELKPGAKNYSVINDWADQQEHKARLAYAFITFLGFDFDELKQFDAAHWQQRLKERKASGNEVGKLIASLLKERTEARKNKDFSRADQIRDGFKEAGVEVKDGTDGSTWELSPEFDAEKLENI
jgi:cysteinyl-tRNA synthetase